MQCVAWQTCAMCNKASNLSSLRGLTSLIFMVHFGCIFCATCNKSSVSCHIWIFLGLGGVWTLEGYYWVVGRFDWYGREVMSNVVAESWV
jgi:hypothetical protein